LAPLGFKRTTVLLLRVRMESHHRAFASLASVFVQQPFPRCQQELGLRAAPVQWTLGASNPLPLPIVAVLFPWQGLCYNHRAVERAQNQEAPSVGPKRDAEVVFSQATDASHDSQVGVDRSAVAHDQDQQQTAGSDLPALAPGEDASRYCPVCWQRLESRRCKLICPQCGYYMSCADYY
jgi:hypothetical protein